MTPTLLPVLALPLAVALAAPADRVVTDTTLVTKANEAAVRLLVDPGAPAMPILTEEAAARAGLKAGPFGIGYRVGPVMVAGRSAVGRIGLGDAPAKRRIGWTANPYAPGYDGVVGPGGLPDPVVRFQLRAARPDERTIDIPMADDGGLFGNWGASNGVLTIDGQPLQVRFSLQQDATIATAGAALTLAKAFGGTLDDDRAEAEIVFGVKRPVRTLRLARPFTIGPIALTTLLARTTDFGNADGIAASGTTPDPDEVVVTAKGKRDHKRDRVILGRSALSGCSSVAFDKPAKLIRLTCL
ncbi:hypothetical protein [Sphingomonas sp. Leaf33]|uniref:hypothetical protein n=1 Tax=Sphingomonas sp. Leaf33 TaxID=1736215 RepID=UPI000AA32550|nr:hypothetical protein [Sphingomonas sp. Leaf33]